MLFVGTKLNILSPVQLSLYFFPASGPKFGSKVCYGWVCFLVYCPVLICHLLSDIPQILLSAVMLTLMHHSEKSTISDALAGAGSTAPILYPRESCKPKVLTNTAQGRCSNLSFLLCERGETKSFSSNDLSVANLASLSWSVSLPLSVITQTTLWSLQGLIQTSV